MCVYVCECVYMHVYMCICMCVCVYMHVYVCILYVCMCVYYMCVCVYSCVCVCVRESEFASVSHHNVCCVIGPNVIPSVKLTVKYVCSGVLRTHHCLLTLNWHFMSLHSGHYCTILQ